MLLKLFIFELPGFFAIELICDLGTLDAVYDFMALPICCCLELFELFVLVTVDSVAVAAACICLDAEDER